MPSAASKSPPNIPAAFSSSSVFQAVTWMVNRGIQRLHSLLAKAVNWKVIDKHPFSGIKPLRHDRSGHVRYLNESEESELLAALQARDDKLRQERDRFNEWLEYRGRPTFPRHTNRFVDHLTPLVLLAMNTGLRRGELFQLEWKDTDLVDKLVTVTGAKAKSGQTRRLPLNQEAYEVLTSWKAQCPKSVGSHVFPGIGGSRLTTINTAWCSLKAKAGLPDFRFHDLRHHFASRLVQSGIDLNTVRELLGHDDITMVLRYAHMSPDRLSMAVEQVARRPPELRHTILQIATEQTRGTARYPPSIRRLHGEDCVRDYVETHLAADIGLPELDAAVSLSQYYFIRAYNKLPATLRINI